MKKSFKFKIVSLALCAISCLVLAMATFTKTVKTANATTQVTATTMHTLEGFTINETASVRRVEPMGIRFTTVVSAEQKTEIIDLLGGDASKVQFGTLILPTDMLGSKELTHDTPSVVIAVPTKWNTETVYTAVLGGPGGKTNLGPSYYDRPISARSFAINTETGKVYYTENTASRSIGFVAYKASVAGDKNDYVTTVANATTKELVFNENVSIHNAESEGSIIVSNEYDKSSANAFAFKIGGIVDLDTTVSYTSSNESAISVENGELVAVGEGVSTVTATVTVDEIVYELSKAISTAEYAPSSSYKILVPKNADSYETQAAKKLQSIIKEATGVNFAIVTESGNETTAEKYISIGDTVLATTNCDLDGLAKDTASRVKTVGNTVFVRGATKIATLYGVQQLLGDVVGYEYYMDNSYRVDKKKEVAIEDKDYIPAIEYEVAQTEGYGAGVATEHAVVSYVDNVVPVGADDYTGVVHNSVLVLNDGRTDTTAYAPIIGSNNKDYKEWYATYKTGLFDRTTYRTDANGYKLELCYTAHGNSSERTQMLNLVAERMYSQMVKDAYKSYDRIGFSLSDAQNWCECDACLAKGNAADNMLEFLADLVPILKGKLQAVGDQRANTFRIFSLFYNSTNVPATNYGSYMKEDIGKHLEIWFAETRADYVVSLRDEASRWNDDVLGKFNTWKTIADTYGADLLWWGYYANVKDAFTPYNSINALRGNYSLAQTNGVDYMFNQMIAYNVNWAKLKYYLMSELRWNANPTEEEWNGWIADFMTASYGAGASAMTEYYNAWTTWATTNQDNFLMDGEYADNFSTTTSIGKNPSEIYSTSTLTLETLKSWLASCNKALASLDKNDSKYQTYYNNIVLERLTPLYLIMVNYGLTPSYSNQSTNSINSYTVKTSANVTPYAQDFLDGVELWGVTTYGEGRSIEPLITALENAVSGITEYEDSARQIVVSGTSITLANANISAGETYSATLTSGNGVITVTGVTASNGSVTLTLGSAPAVGVSYDVVLRSSSKVITFTDVFVVTGTISTYAELSALSGPGAKSGYYILTANIDATGNTIAVGRGNNFSGVLDGNNYTVTGLTNSSSGMFSSMSGATVKDVVFEEFSATSSYAFTASANNTTFENVTLSFSTGGAGLLVTNETNVTYNNVTVYTSADVSAVPYGITVVKGSQVDTDLTFYVVDGQNELWIKDANLAKGKYQVNINGEIKEYTSFTAGRLQISLGYIKPGETVEVSCSNGEENRIYSVCCVAKITEGSVNGESLDEFDGNESTIGYVNGTYVQQMVTETITQDWWQTTNYPNEVVDSNGKTREQLSAVIVMPEDKDWLSVDISVSNAVGTANLFHAWGTADGALTAFGEIGATTVTTSAGLQAQFLDKYGFRVSSLSAKTVYTMQLKKDGTEFFKLANVIREGMTVYFANVIYGTGELPTPNTPPNVTMGDNREYSIYDGDETALGYAEGTMVFNLANATPDNIYGDGWVKRLIFGASTAQDYITFEFVAKEDVEASNVFHVWGAQGTPSIGTVSASTGKGGDWAIILDEYGFAATSIKAGKHYFASIACAGLTEVQVGLLDANEFYVANVTEHNGSLPTPRTALFDGASYYDGDVTALGFAEDSEVYKYETSNYSSNRLYFEVDSTNYDYVEVDVNITSSTTWFFMWGLKDSSWHNSGKSYVMDPSNLRFSDNSTCDRRIEFYNADGTKVTTLLSSNTLYTIRIYIKVGELTKICFAQNMTMYIANLRFGEEIIYPDNVIKYSTDGGHTNEVLPKYTGDQAAYGFGAEDFVFEGAMTSSWNDRVIIPVDSTNYDYMDVEFVVTSGAWYFNAWVVNANGMLDGSYLVAENASNSTYGSGYAPHTPNTGANGGNTRIQVLDVDGNVVTGGRTVGTRYILRVYTNDESLTGVQLGQDNTTILFANVTYGIEETIVGTTNTSCVTVYDGDETALGFADGSRVYTYVGTDASIDKASFKVDSTYDYVEVQFVIGSGDGYFFGYALNGGNYLNNGSSYVIDPSNLRLASGSAMDRVIEVYDANGNAVSTLMSTNTLYTLRVYTDGMDEFRIAKAGSTIYLANVTHGNDSAIELPENVVTDASGATLSKYDGEQTTYGFSEEDYVFEQTISNLWNDRVIIAADNNYKYLDVQFVVTDGNWWFTVWVCNASGMLDGSYLVAEQATSAGNAHATFGDGYAKYNGTNAGNTRIQVLSYGVAVVGSRSVGTLYTLRVWLEAENLTEIQIGKDNGTMLFANVNCTDEEPQVYIKQGDAGTLLPEYTGDVTSVGFEEGTLVQTLVGSVESGWGEAISSERARISADGTQDYISVDFVLATAHTGSLFQIWPSSGSGTLNMSCVTSVTTAEVTVVDEYGFVVSSIEVGKRYTLRVYDPGATSLAIGVYGLNTVYFGNVTYGTGEPEVYNYLTNNNGVLATVDGDVTTLGFGEGEYVQQATTGSWGESTGVRLYGDENSYVSVMFSLASDFNLSSGNLLYGWAHDPNDTTNNTYLDAYSCYVIGSNASSSCRVFAVNGNAITDNTLKANTVYMLEIYFATGVVYYNIGGVPTDAITIYFAPKSVKTYSTSYSASITYKNNAMTLYQGNETDIGFNKGEVIWQLTTTDIEEGGNWYTAPSGGGYSRSQLLAVVPTTVGQVVSIRFAVSEDFSSTSSLFFIWGYPSGSNSATTQAISLSTTGDCCILDVNGNAVNSLSANTVYVLKLYMADVAKYEIGNIYSTGMTTYFSSDIAYADYTA